MRREDFVAAARSYIGTPFVHQGRLPVVGLDCAGVVVCAARACGEDIGDMLGYPHIPTKGVLEQAVLARCDAVALADVVSGDIMLFKFLREPQHLAVFDGGRIIHAYRSVGRVVENSFDATWQSRLVGCYRLKGVA